MSVRARVRVASVLSGLLAVPAAAPAAAPAADPAGRALRVTANEAFLPCVSAAGRAYTRASGTPVLAGAGPADGEAADVLVGSSLEINRALESGAARTDSDVVIARVPWVLVVVEKGVSVAIESLSDLRASGATVEVLGGPAAHEARRALGVLPPERVRETRDIAALRSSRLALVPLPLAGAGRRIPVDIAPLVAAAAVVKTPQKAEAALAFVAWLGSDAGQQAFASCGSP
jgi:hypothetical protein